MNATSSFDLQIGALAAIVRSSHQAIVAVDRDVPPVSWNASAERMMGYKAAEIIGRRAPENRRRVHPRSLVAPDRVAKAERASPTL
jgi:PAS domain S-box-containing protein